MKLLNITSRYFLLLVLVLLPLWCVVLYFSLKSTLNHDLDEYLMNRKHIIMNSFREDPRLITQEGVFRDEFKVKEISHKEFKKFSKRHRRGKFRDTWVYDQREKEDEPFRKMESVFTYQGKHYKLIVIASLLNSEELLVTILINVLLFSIILLAMIVVLNRGLLRKLWSPFYDTIKKVKQFRLDKDHALDFSDTHILEFQELNQSISELIQNNRKVYLSQKQFIENASHEMQTPLGIIRNKVDTLAELPSLTLEQAGLIDAITEHTDRLARLNKTLLLLSKIENNQFSENESIDLSVMIGACCDDFADLLEFKKLKLTVDKQGNAFVQMNPDLSRVLFSNLIKNAINHNIIDGFIQINIESTKVVIVNSGKELTSSPDALFERFNKKSDSAQSNGLGLSIVKSICSFYDFTVSYTYQTQVHTISIVFKS